MVSYLHSFIVFTFHIKHSLHFLRLTVQHFFSKILHSFFILSSLKFLVVSYQYPHSFRSLSQWELWYYSWKATIMLYYFNLFSIISLISQNFIPNGTKNFLYSSYKMFATPSMISLSLFLSHCKQDILSLLPFFSSLQIVLFAILVQGWLIGRIK